MPALEVEGGFPAGESNLDLPAVHASGTVGVFDGFTLGPTVGGFASLDLTFSTHWIRTPEDRGFHESVLGWGAGARIGVLRESFSLPGITVTAFHRSLGKVDLWDIDGGDPSEAHLDLQVSSARGVIGKDFWGIGVFGGAGWDRYSGDVSLRIADPEGGTSPGNASGNLRSDRYLFFAGASRTFLTLQISGEVGWAQGFDPRLPASYPGGFDPSSSSEFGSLALRLTF
jgi:hypothetical protein